MLLPAFLALLTCLARAEADATLVQKLRQGGYVLYMRHGSTDFSQNDLRMQSYEDCASVCVVQPDAPSVPAVVGRIRVEDWQALH